MDQVTQSVAVEGRGILPNLKHGSEGKQDRVLREIEDPVTGESRPAVAVIRRHGVEQMHKRKQITDRQKDAADRFSMIYERAHSDGMKAIDYSRVRVDGSQVGFGGVDARIRGANDLERMRKAVGLRGYEILVKIAVEGKSVKEVALIIATRTGDNARSVETYVSMRLKEALDDLDALWNVAVGSGSAMRATGNDNHKQIDVQFERMLPEGVTQAEYEAELEEVKASLIKTRRNKPAA